MELTERHHACIAALYYSELEDREIENRRDIFVFATRMYGEGRGRRMALRAMRDGQPLSFSSYKRYGEWRNTETVKKEMGGNISEEKGFDPDYVTEIFVCPWAKQFADMGMKECGSVYCSEIDRSIVRGFSPFLKFETLQSLNERDRCIQVMYDAHFIKGEIPMGDDRYRRDFSYHCAHIYYTFRKTIVSVLGKTGEEIADSVKERFIGLYGEELFKMIRVYENEDFEVI